MAIIADSGGIYGLYDRGDSTHAGIRAVIERERDRIVIPSPVLGEIDYLLRSRIGVRSLSRFLSDIAIGAFQVECVTAEDWNAAPCWLRNTTIWIWDCATPP